MDKVQSLNFFKSSVLDPDFIIHDLVEDENHVYHDALMRDLQSIDANDLHLFCEEHNVDFFIGAQDNSDLKRRIEYLVNYLRYQIAKERRQYLVNDDYRQRPHPYSFDEVRDIPIDENGLVSVQHLEPHDMGVLIGDYVYVLCPSLIQICS